MTYFLGAIVVTQTLAFLVLIQLLVRSARRERQELEDRLMSISNPVALSVSRPEVIPPGNVTYVDEAREAELSPSWSP